MLTSENAELRSEKYRKNAKKRKQKYLKQNKEQAEAKHTIFYYHG